MTTCIFIFLLTIIASFIQRVSGFGFGIFVMMFFPFFLPSYGESVMLSGLLAGSTALMIAVRNWKYIRWRLMGWVVFFNVLFSFLATEYMRSMSNDALKQCLGVALILIALYFFFGEGRMGRIFQSKPAQVTIGSISGIMGVMAVEYSRENMVECIGLMAIVALLLYVLLSEPSAKNVKITAVNIKAEEAAELAKEKKEKAHEEKVQKAEAKAEIKAAKKNNKNN